MSYFVPVIGLTGVLGSGKTTILNRVLRRRGARIGVIVNDFGAVNIDAGLVTGHVDEVAAITGGCICCLPDTSGLDDALTALARPELRLDVIIVEASGVADPLSLAHLLRYSGAEYARFGGIVEVIDSTNIETGGGEWTQRLNAASLVVVNKLDMQTARTSKASLATVRRAAESSPSRPTVVGARHGNLDPRLLFDIAQESPAPNELDFSALYSHEHHEHVETSSAWVGAPHPVDAGHLLDFLESPPPHAYRIKGRVAIRTPRGARRYVINTVGRSIHVVADTLPPPALPGLVCIGPCLNVDRAENRLAVALSPAEETAAAPQMRRLRRHLRLSR